MAHPSWGRASSHTPSYGCLNVLFFREAFLPPPSLMIRAHGLCTFSSEAFVTTIIKEYYVIINLMSVSQGDRKLREDGTNTVPDRSQSTEGELLWSGRTWVSILEQEGSCPRKTLPGGGGPEANSGISSFKSPTSSKYTPTKIQVEKHTLPLTQKIP